jgi:hypothetical protein
MYLLVTLGKLSWAMIINPANHLKVVLRIASTRSNNLVAAHNGGCITPWSI